MAIKHLQKHECAGWLLHIFCRDMKTNQIKRSILLSY